ncbi:hypothetical protein IJI99_03525 [bacterium]|nr:hypothetical protein [bacterium]
MTKQTIKKTITVSVLALMASLCMGTAWAQNANNNGGSSISTSSTLDGYVTSDLVVGFPIEAAVNNGAIRVLIPTATQAANLTGAPTPNAFVSDGGANPGAGSETVTPPTSVSGMTFGTCFKQNAFVWYDAETATEIAEPATPVDGQHIRYLSYVCPYTGSGSLGGQFTNDMVAGQTSSSIVISELINPSAPVGATINEAVVIPGKVQVLESGSYNASAQTVVDYSSIYNYMVSDYDVLISAIMQDVLVTARVEYQIMFRVDGVDTSETACNSNPDVSSTSTLIDYGTPSTNSPVNAAQRIFVSSSVNNGYKIVVTQNGNMARQDSLTPVNCSNDGYLDGTSEMNRDCIPNFGWRNASGTDTLMPHNESAAWTNYTKQTGLGYRMEVNHYTGQQSGSNNNPTVNSLFADGKFSRLATRDSSSPYATSYSQELAPITAASSEGLADGDWYDVCYRLVVDAQNNAGVYSNDVTYTITASL